MSAQNKHTGEIIRNCRLAKGFTQIILSEMTNVSLRSIQRIEKGEVQPRRDTLNLLASALEIDLGNFIIHENYNAQSTITQPRQLNKVILHIGTAMLTLLLGGAYLSQSPKFPETTFEMFMFWALVTFIYLIVTFRIWRSS